MGHSKPVVLKWTKHSHNTGDASDVNVCFVNACVLLMLVLLMLVLLMLVFC